MDELSLQEDYQKAVSLCDKKQAEINQVKNDLEAVIVLLVDADSKNRPALIQSRGELSNLKSTLIDELAGLILRRDAADLTRFEYALSMAEIEFEKRMQSAKEAKDSMNAALDELRNFHNGVYRKTPTTELDNLRFELEGDLAVKKAKSSVAGREFDKARVIRNMVKDELESAKERQKITEY